MFYGKSIRGKLSNIARKKVQILPIATLNLKITLATDSRYGDSVMEVDYGVGVLLAKLRELKIEDNTLVFFSSDNGAGTCATSCSFAKLL